MVRNHFLLMLLPAMLWAAGCSSQPRQEESPDVSAVSDLVYDLPDLAGHPNRFQQLFTADAAPSAAQRQRYSAVFLRLAKPPTFAGQQATLTVEVTSDDQKSTVEWTAVKEAGGWKLSSAPLP